MHGVLKGTNLFCYQRQEDLESGVEPAFTIVINKVGTGWIIILAVIIAVKYINEI